jgi:hypothetical protein
MFSALRATAPANVFHPEPHGYFIDISVDDDSDDAEDRDTPAEQEERGPPMIHDEWRWEVGEDGELELVASTTWFRN